MQTWVRKLNDYYYLNIRKTKIWNAAIKNGSSAFPLKERL
ncbi:hypothetical protein PBAL39_03594 [Pedobacter sp. BAL39]|nr:hypothetical protein PBAL39_03594 [Pedobacter sp. BAL39]